MQTPRNVGRYQVTQRVAAGSFATVWHARDAELDTDVAIKILAENWAGSDDVRSRFTEEARMLRRADSDRVVRVYDIGSLDDGRPYFVMSYADRGTLHDRLTGGRLPVQLALQHAIDTGRGLAALHELGILHRDLKPSNILFISGGSAERLLIADLGLAKSMAHGSGVTITGGTPGYMAPEQAQHGGRVDQRTDVYGLGAVTYHMLTGAAPFATTSGQPIIPPSQLCPDLGGQVDALVMRALDRDPANRWPDVASYIQALTQLSGTHRTQPAAPATVLAPGTPSDQTAAQQPHQVPPTIGPESFPQAQPAMPQPAGGVLGDGFQLAPLASLPKPKRRILGIRVPVLVASVSAFFAIMLIGTAVIGGDRVLMRIPTTLASDDGAVSIRMQPLWSDADDIRPEYVSETIDLGAADYGVPSGKGVRLSTQQAGTDNAIDMTELEGVTVVAGKAFADATPRRVAASYPASWQVTEDGDCTEQELRKLDADEFAAAFVHTYACGGVSPSGYLHAFVTTEEAGAHVFLKAPFWVDATVDDMEDVVRTLEIDASKLP